MRFNMSVIEETSSEPSLHPNNEANELVTIAEIVLRGEPSPRISVRKLLTWFDAQRRGLYVVQTIRDELKRLGIETIPDFNEVWIDSEIAFATSTTVVEPQLAAASMQPEVFPSTGPLARLRPGLSWLVELLSIPLIA
jgi:hypothetical protein